MELRPDAVIAGKLRLLRPLGQGGMGVVWAARHLTLETDVAVKFLRPERVAADPGLVTRFEREAKTTARIAHPHVVRVMDYGAVDSAVPYIVMELLHGFSLAELLERGGRLSVATAKSLATQLGSALESAHEHGIVHRDIKPHNILVTEGRRDYPLVVKVLDFGVAKMLSDVQVPGASAALTETGMVIGSPPYMSPEQLEGRSDVDLRSDLWSLGVIVYETLTGTRPFHGSSLVTVGAAVLKGRYAPVSTLRPNLPPAIDDWLAKALCVDPDGRFQSAREMVAAFVDIDVASATAFAAGMVEVVRGTELADIALVDTAIAPAPDMSTNTVSHSPIAMKPPPREPALVDTSRDTPRAPLKRRNRLVWMGAAGAAVIVCIGLGAPGRSAGPAACPSGMVLIEGASFQMGSAADGETPSDETPIHGEKVASYCLDRTEVTVKAYSECASCERPERTVEFEGLTPNGRAFESQFCNGDGLPDHPINCVGWNQAKAYCAARGKRLPTEPEWELAARGLEGRIYPWGQAPPSGERLNACGSECSRMLTERRRIAGTDSWPAMYPEDDGAASTAPVGSHPKGSSPGGVLDLAGNVWEWTDSAYCPYGKSDCGDSRRVLRGGGWDSTEIRDVRATRRFPGAPTARGRSIGFRCAETP